VGGREEGGRLCKIYKTEREKSLNFIIGAGIKFLKNYCNFGGNGV
jgi:hypothetical protein